MATPSEEIAQSWNLPSCQRQGGEYGPPEPPPFPLPVDGYLSRRNAWPMFPPASAKYPPCDNSPPSYRFRWIPPEEIYDAPEMRSSWTPAAIPQRAVESWWYSLAVYNIENPHLVVDEHVAITAMEPAATAQLKAYWAAHLPTTGDILDFHTAGMEHFPLTLWPAVWQDHLRITTCGPYPGIVFGNCWRKSAGVLLDFNRERRAAFRGLTSLGDGRFDAVINVLSIHCISHPLEVIEGLWRLTKDGGSIHLVLRESTYAQEAGTTWQGCRGEDVGYKVLAVANLLYMSGWRDIELVEMTDSGIEYDHSAVPLFVVRATKSQPDFMSLSHVWD
ncbi:hypothetical protein F4802DRAFT_569392 [Xylaria palmicola]|nr:hypothetical protein F4802DRAFT_569392 [Xylaria palmicola]